MFRNEKENNEQPHHDDDFYHEHELKEIAYDKIIIEKGAQINVNGKGMYGTKLILVEVDILNGGDKNFNSSGAKDIYSGGGYGTPSKSIIDYSTNGQFQIINGISPNPQYKSRNNFKNKKDKSQPNGEILCGGHVYGD